jgi:hypothetical protein
MQEFYKMIFKGKPIFKERKVFSKPFLKNLLKNCWQGTAAQRQLDQRISAGNYMAFSFPGKGRNEADGNRYVFTGTLFTYRKHSKDFSFS